MDTGPCQVQDYRCAGISVGTPLRNLTERFLAANPL